MKWVLTINEILLLGIALGVMCILICLIIRINYVKKIKPKVMRQKQIFEAMNDFIVSKRKLRH